MLSRITSAQEILNKNAELSARLQLALRAEAKLKEVNEKMLEEELRWLKAQ